MVLLLTQKEMEKVLHSETLVSIFSNKPVVQVHHPELDNIGCQYTLEVPIQGGKMVFLPERRGKIYGGNEDPRYMVFSWFGDNPMNGTAPFFLRGKDADQEQAKYMAQRLGEYFRNDAKFLKDAVVWSDHETSVERMRSTGVYTMPMDEVRAIEARYGAGGELGKK